MTLEQAQSIDRMFPEARGAGLGSLLRGLDYWRNNRVIEGFGFGTPTTPSTQGSGAVAATWLVNRYRGSIIVNGFHFGFPLDLVDTPAHTQGANTPPVLAVGQSVISVVVGLAIPQYNLAGLLSVYGAPATTGTQVVPTDAQIAAKVASPGFGLPDGYFWTGGWIKVSKLTLNRTGDTTVTQNFDNSAWKDV
jgi:hypothetical protein